MIRSGTCSWAEKTLVESGEFYPDSARSAEGRLRYYASRLDTVEVDSTYYAIPSSSTTALWAGRAPDGFLFHVKVYGALTGHGIDATALPKAIRALLPASDQGGRSVRVTEPQLLDVMAAEFFDALEPLRSASKLGVLVYQFPPWFRCDRESFAFILACRERSRGLTVGVEFRHGSWLVPRQRENTFAFLRDNGLTYITADEPQYGSLATVPFLPEVTSDIAYFRLHGRNRDTWLKRGIETSLRYNYQYSDEELRGFVPVLKEAEGRPASTFVMFNNCYRASGIRNALRMKEILQETEQRKGSY